MLKTANGGITKNINGYDIEILSHNFHNPNCDIVCFYFMENGNKTEVTYYKDIISGCSGHEIYKFKSANEIQHYKSYNYSKTNLPKKYNDIANKLIEIHSQINFNDYQSRFN